MKTIEILKLIVSLLPMLIDAVKAIEVAMPQGGQGEAKLAAVRTVLEGAYKTGTDASVAFEQVWPALSATVGAVVTLCNQTGVFKAA